MAIFLKKKNVIYTKHQKNPLLLTILANQTIKEESKFISQFTAENGKNQPNADPKTINQCTEKIET